MHPDFFTLEAKDPLSHLLIRKAGHSKVSKDFLGGIKIETPPIDSRDFLLVFPESWEDSKKRTKKLKEKYTLILNQSEKREAVLCFGHGAGVR